MFKDYKEDLKNKIVPVTEEMLKEAKATEYASGRGIEIGDKVVFGMFASDKDGNVLSLSELEKNVELNNEIFINIKTFHPDEVGELYEVVNPENNVMGTSYQLFIKK